MATLCIFSHFLRVVEIIKNKEKYRIDNKTWSIIGSSQPIFVEITILFIINPENKKQDKINKTITKTCFPFIVPNLMVLTKTNNRKLDITKKKLKINHHVTLSTLPIYLRFKSVDIPSFNKPDLYNKSIVWRIIKKTIPIIIAIFFIFFLLSGIMKNFDLWILIVYIFCQDKFGSFVRIALILF